MSVLGIPTPGVASLSRTHTSWEDLPLQTRRAVEDLVGQVQSARTISVGRNAQLSCVLRTSQAVLFAKGVPSNHRGVGTQRNEALVGAHLEGISPKVLHHLDTGEWNILLFDHFDGRPADLTQRSPDFRLLEPLLERVLAKDARNIPGVLPVVERWAHLSTNLDFSLLSGSSLIHPDLNRGNILIGKSQSMLVDWALPGQGAAWINLAFFTFFLMNEGWPPAQAESWVNRFRAWKEADPHAIRTFVTALTRRRSEQASSAPQLRRMERLRQERLALEWLQHRTATYSISMTGMPYLLKPNVGTGQSTTTYSDFSELVEAKAPSGKILEAPTD
ncbi:aminoglycoside phosphotransferase/choline kinase family protein [Streptomyces celluloflavus]|uniref:hypothetical protein n=1 Tax=Streptomyces celluloflavus TaxID=58344 RepID=UPI00345F9220|nr:hypothetical protein OG717_30180 [Streptomyces celluloflavus]